MKIFRITGLLCLMAFLGLIPLKAAQAAPPCSAPFLVQIDFPGATPSQQTHWDICWQMVSRFGLEITYAAFSPSPTVTPIKVLFDGRMAEILVAYHQGKRFLDIGGNAFGWIPLSANGKNACPGTAFSASGTGTTQDVCKEVHDRGFVWFDHSTWRRGQELVLWGVLNADNYNYIIEWTFRDDGEISARAGSSGVVLPTLPTVTHVHNFTWRLDLDLNGETGDSVGIVSHSENMAVTPSVATDTLAKINNDAEGGVELDPVAFNSMIISDATLKNSLGHSTTYELIPIRTGTGRHSEPFSQKDIWVTRYHAGELIGSNLPSYVAPAEPTASQDLVEWITGSFHHIVRDEDGQSVGNSWQGTTPLEWVGVVLKPNNLFNTTPFYP